ncbi:MAG: MBL fold metallo-hydrolase [Oscillospiraceae bacterium]|nr:MBL fold metallo-hydrolase [Oscillospiraceae bacterium]
MLEQITVNTQSSIRVAAGAVIRFDPYQIDGAPHDADIVFLTHAHYDHFSPEDLRRVMKPDTVLAAPASMREELRQAGFMLQKAFQAGESGDVSGYSVKAVASYNLNKPFHPKSNGWLGYIVTVNGCRIYVAGDTDATPEAAAVQCDLALLPIGGTYTMNYKEAAALTRKIQPQAVIPTHYGSIVGKKEDGRYFADAVGSEIQVVLRL